MDQLDQPPTLVASVLPQTPSFLFTEMMAEIEAVQPTPLDLDALSKSTDSPKKRGKVSTNEALVRRTNFYIVPWNGLFYYYPVRLELPEIDKFVSHQAVARFLTKPPILHDGIVIINAEAYFVSADNLKAGRIFPGNQFFLPRRTLTYKEIQDGIFKRNTWISTVTGPDGGALGKSPAALSGNNGGTPPAAPHLLTFDSELPFPVPRDANSQGSREEVELAKELAQADLAFKDQVRTLYGVEDTEEDWEQEA